MCLDPNVNWLNCKLNMLSSICYACLTTAEDAFYAILRKQLNDGISIKLLRILTTQDPKEESVPKKLRYELFNPINNHLRAIESNRTLIGCDITSSA